MRFPRDHELRRYYDRMLAHTGKVSAFVQEDVLQLGVFGGMKNSNPIEFIVEDPSAPPVSQCLLFQLFRQERNSADIFILLTSQGSQDREVSRCTRRPWKDGELLCGRRGQTLHEISESFVPSMLWNRSNADSLIASW